MNSKKLTKRDVFAIFLGMLLIAIFIAIRYYLTGRIFDWILQIFDTVIALFSVGVLIVILNELFGKRIIKRITQG